MKKTTHRNILRAAAGASALALALTGCGGAASSAATSAASEATSTASSTAAAATGEKETLEFYHGYFHDEATWAPAAIMREIYDDFAAQHADGDVVFKPIPVENKEDIMKNMVSGGKFPDMIDLAGSAMSAGAVAQGLVYDMKPYLDQEKLQDQIGINYTQNEKDGAIYTVHDQLLTIGYWYNEQIMKDAGATMPDTWATWDDFSTAMGAVRTYGAANGIYAYGAGQGSSRIFNAMLALSDEGKAMLEGELTPDMVKSETFASAFKAVAAMDQENGSQNTSNTANDFSADFNEQKSSVFFNGVWAAGGFGEETNFQPAVFPGDVALSSAGAGFCIASGMSEAKTQLALEFVKYMTSEEVQTRIFAEVGANPCNTKLDLAALAAASGNASTELLAKACSQANSAATIVPTMDAVWGSDVNDIISTKLQECAVSGTDIEAKAAEMQDELVAILS